jgi:lipopolysaccharide export system protein LptA
LKRSLVLMLTTVGALLCVFIVYTRLAAPPSRADDQPMPITTSGPAAGAAGQQFAAGAWVNLYDKDGQFYGRLRSQACVPQPDHLYHLTAPEGEFYQHDGQIVHLTATEGDVIFGDQTRQTPLNGGPVQAPKQGTLQNVVVEVYPGQSARDRHDPDLTIHMDNAQFDTDTYRLCTMAAGAVPADQVPVTLRGRDVDFDGRGLLLYWDDEVHELRSLRVEHGERLRLKNMADANPKSAKPSQDVAPVQSASSTPAPPAAVAAPVGAMPPKAPAFHSYLATFNDNVHVLQNGQERVQASEMDVTLALRNETESSGSANPPPSPPPATQSPVQSPTTAMPAPVSMPTAQAKQSDVDVFWTGPLTVKPAPGVTLAPEQRIIGFTGSPVHLRQDNLDIVGERVRYDTSTGAARVVGKPDEPMTLTMLKRDGSTAGTVSGDQVDYFRDRDLAVFAGKGIAQFADPNKSGDLLRAGWATGCNVTLGGSGDQPYITQADLQGDAWVIDGPADQAAPDKLRLGAQRIVADFDPPATKTKTQTPAVLRRMVATGNSLCIIHDQKEPERSLASDQLIVEAAKDSQGNLYPRFVVALGKVHGVQEDQEIWSQRLDATVAPIAQKVNQSHYEVQSLLATGDVRAHGKNGQTAAGDALSVEEQGGEQFITLIGNPRAVVTGDNGVLRGPEIQFKPKESWANIVGPGTINCISSDQPGKPPRPMHVEWTKSALMDGDQNFVDVRGDVAADTKEETGTVKTGSADHALLLLTPTPTTHKSSTKSKENTDPLGGKQVRLMELLGHANVGSILARPDGSIVRRAYLFGDRIDADLPKQKLTVPGPGRMLLEDHGKTTAAAPTTQPAQGRGVTAFQWDKQFIFDQLANRAVIDGAVKIVHQADGSKTQSTVRADEVTADFEPAVQKAATEPATDEPPAASDVEPKLKHVVALGHVHIYTDTATIDAREVDYDPAAEELVAIGTEDDPVEVLTKSPHRAPESYHFSKVWVDTRTNQIKRMQDFSGESGR